MQDRSLVTIYTVYKLYTLHIYMEFDSIYVSIQVCAKVYRYVQ